MVSCPKCGGFLRIISDDGKKIALECSTCGLGMSLRSKKKEKKKEKKEADQAVMFAGMS